MADDEGSGAQLHWYDDDAGPMVRPFTVTRGRTRPATGQDFDLLAEVRAVPGAEPAVPLDHARSSLLDQVRRGPRPLAELAADADLPVGALRVLLGDLLDDGLVQVAAPATRAGRPDVRLLHEVIQGLRRL
ncbi:DUF742 domain-containing protein [Kitasatospora atroaurantiaca]|uniref:Uncharacterized protein DUF742 n=1 Tax=Kitasatospora atroaurantiaca TaxID=285545 RepID=A0A561EQY4_9ACTN|nr:DUF742 domain-containing protein [Kitasatospora atroaurantiaca]TWE18022.1 uncharacterized protein DUF742 [Kitasatospora atroaurantiaca]